MDLGLGNRATVKAFVLPPSLAAGTDFNSALDFLARAVALRIEKHCNRKFTRVVDDVFETDAARYHISLPRYPVEEVTSLERRQLAADAWEDDTGLIDGQDYAAGLLHFASLGGANRERLRVTYTAGYWFETLEPADLAYPTTQPADTTAIPADLQLAWLLQLKHCWAQGDKLGVTFAEKPEGGAALASLALIPEVVAMLAPYVRRSIT